MNVGQRQAAVDPHAKPTDLRCEFNCRLLSSTPHHRHLMLLNSKAGNSVYHHTTEVCINLQPPLVLFLGNFSCENTNHLFTLTTRILSLPLTLSLYITTIMIAGISCSTLLPSVHSYSNDDKRILSRVGQTTALTANTIHHHTIVTSLRNIVLLPQRSGEARSSRVWVYVESGDSVRRSSPNVESVLRPPRRQWRGLYILPLNFLPRTVIAARRRSGAPSKVYQWLGPRCRHKATRKNFANRPSPLIFTNYRGSKSAKFGLDSQNQSPLTGSSFKTKQHIGNLKHVSEAQMIALNMD